MTTLRVWVGRTNALLFRHLHRGSGLERAL